MSGADVLVAVLLGGALGCGVLLILAPTGAVSDGGVVEASLLFAMRDGFLRATGAVPGRLERFELAGLDPLPILRGAV